MSNRFNYGGPVGNPLDTLIAEALNPGAARRRREQEQQQAALIKALTAGRKRGLFPWALVLTCGLAVAKGLGVSIPWLIVFLPFLVPLALVLLVVLVVAGLFGAAKWLERKEAKLDRFKDNTERLRNLR